MMKRTPAGAKGAPGAGQQQPNTRRGSNPTAGGAPPARTAHASPSPAGGGRRRANSTNRTSPSPLPHNPSGVREHPTKDNTPQSVAPTTATRGNSNTRHSRPSATAATSAPPPAPPPPMPRNAADHELVAIATYMDVVATSIAHRTKSIANPPPIAAGSSGGLPSLQRVGAANSSSMPDLIRPPHHQHHQHDTLSPFDGRSRAGTSNNSPVDASTVGREVELLAPSGRTSAWSDGAGGGRTASPPPTSHGSDSTPPSLQPTTSSSDLFRLQRASILEKVQLFGNGLLHWYGTLETKRLPGDTTLDAVGHNITVLSKNLHQALNDCVLRCETLCAGGSSDGANEALWRYYKAFFDDCFTNLGQMTAAAKTLVLMRRLVASRDAERVAAVLEELQASTKAASGGGKQAALGGGQAAAFVQWVQRQWLPAMREWESVVERARSDVEAAGGTAAAAERAIAATHREVASRSASIREILLPGETVEQLLQDGVEKDLKALGSRLEAQHQAMANLRQAVAAVDFVQLATCLRAVSVYVPTLTSADDKAAVAGAEKLLVDVQLVAKATVGLSLAIKSRDPKMLLRAIVAANDTMAALRICSSTVSMQAAQARGKQWLARLDEIASLSSEDAAAAALAAAAETLPTNVLHVEHVPTRAWAPELSVIYQRACTALDEVLLRVGLERRLATKLALFRGSSDHNEVPDGTARMSTDDLRRLVEQCRAVGVQGPALDAAEQCAQRAESIRIKVHYDSRIRVVAIDQAQAATSFRHVQSRVVGVCPAPAGAAASAPAPALRIRYQDGDGDFISLLDDEDWRAVYSDMVARHRQHGSSSDVDGGGGGMKLEVFCDYPLLPALHSPPGSSSGGVGSSGARLSNAPQSHGHTAAAGAATRHRMHTPATGTTPTNATGPGTPTVPSTGLRVDGVGVGGGAKPLSPAPAVTAAAMPSPPERHSVPPVAETIEDTTTSQPSHEVVVTAAAAAEPQPPPLSERRGSSPRGPIYDAHRAQAVRQSNDASPLAIRIAKDNVSKWESAAAEALELLTVASQETQSARTSLARDVQQPPSVAMRGANRRVSGPGRWADTSDVDTADIQTIASTVDAHAQPTGAPTTAPQRPPSAGHAGSTPPLNSREKSVMMLAQLRKQKQALETASKASQGKASGQPPQGQPSGSGGTAPHRK